MPTLYNRIQGRNVERLTALSDINTWVSITAILRVQSNCAVAPRLWNKKG